MCYVAIESINQTLANLFLPFAIVVGSLSKILSSFEVLAT